MTQHPGSLGDGLVRLTPVRQPPGANSLVEPTDQSVPVSFDAFHITTIETEGA